MFERGEKNCSRRHYLTAIEMMLTAKGLTRDINGFLDSLLQKHVNRVDPDQADPIDTEKPGNMDGDHNEISSIVSDTTADSEQSYPEYPTMWKQLYGIKGKSKEIPLRSVTPSVDSQPPDAVEGTVDSPLLPMQQTLKLKFDSVERKEDVTLVRNNDHGDGDSMSEISQPLIPLKQTSVERVGIQKTVEDKEFDLREPSQSLLPQTLAEKTHWLGHLGLSKNTSKTVINNNHPVSIQNTVQATDGTIGCITLANQEQMNEKQLTGSHKGEHSYLGTQNELTCSQASLPATDKIHARLERLLESLSNVPRKQKRVTEIAVSQCIGKIQNNLHHKLKKSNINEEQKAMLKAYLQTTQSCLIKLFDHLKHEKSLLSSSKVPGNATKTDCILKSTLMDLDQRQKEIHNMLKQQKSLVGRFKEIMSIKTPTKSSNTQAHTDLTQTKPDEVNHTGNLAPVVALESSDYTSSQKMFTLGQQDFNKNVQSEMNTSSKITTEESYKTMTHEKEKLDSVSETDVHIDEHFDMSQDVTTIPDTQEPVSQLTDKLTEERVITGNNHGKVVRDQTSQLKENYKKMPDSTEVEPWKSSRVSKRIVPWSPEQEERKKIRKGISVTTAKTAVVNVDNTETFEPTSYSETLWLTMLHKTTDTVKKPTENAKHTAGKYKTKQDDTEISESAKEVTTTESANIPGYLATDSETEKLKTSETRESINSTSRTHTGIYRRESELKSQNQETKIQEKDCEKECNINVTENAIAKHDTGFTSPDQLCIDADFSTNVSPTATSMSSDVFLVKAKELQRRMKMREKLAARNIETFKPRQPTTDLTETTTVRKGETEGEKKAGKDTISDAIDSVIAKSRNEGKVYAKLNEKGTVFVPENVPKNVSREASFASCDPKSSGNQSYDAARWTKPLDPSTLPYNYERNRTARQETTKNRTARQETAREEVQETAQALPSMKQLLCTGVMSPGKNVLSLLLKGNLHKASLTPFGKVRTAEGLIFSTAMQWLSTLTDGETKKKRSTYVQVKYKGRSILEICKEQEHKKGNNQQSVDSGKTQGSIPEANNKGTQTISDDSSQPSLGQCQRKMTVDEVWLNKLMSSSKIRLLTDQDLIPCNDLPDNFWVENFSKVKLSFDIWETVDKW